MAAMIRLEGVRKRFATTEAVAGADLVVSEGEFVALLGPSGCGKTTLLRLVAGHERPDAGTVSIAGRLVAGPGAWVPPERRRAGMVFQDYALFPHLTVAENVGFGVRRGDRRAAVSRLLELVRLDRHHRRYPHELSGGQQQRVALARALAPEPSVILLDEPWSNIDPLLRSSMREELADILRAVGVTVVLVTHEREEAFSIADKIALMSEGRIVQTGTPEEIYLRPRTRWAAEFVGAANFLPGRLRDDRVETRLGSFGAVGAGPAGRETVEALVRPELLELLPDGGGRGEVVDRQFRGHDVFYRVRLDDGTLLLSQRPSTERVPLGARVSIRPHAAAVPVFA